MATKNECSFCSKKFTRKTYYEKHLLFCELMSKSNKERKLEVEEYEDTPTVRKLYEIILEMSFKYKKMEEKVEELSKFIDSKKKKINIVEWLNTTYKMCEPFDIWMNKINVERKHLESIFNDDFVSGSFLIIKDNMSSDEQHMQVRSYEQKDNALFIFNDGVWSEMKMEQFDKMMDFISKQIIHEFVVWQNENKHRMEDDSYALTYMKNIKKINGGNNTTEQLYRKIHREVYKYLKSNITQYELSF